MRRPLCTLLHKGTVELGRTDHFEGWAHRRILYRTGRNLPLAAATLFRFSPGEFPDQSLLSRFGVPRLFHFHSSTRGPVFRAALTRMGRADKLRVSPSR